MRQLGPATATVINCTSPITIVRVCGVGTRQRTFGSIATCKKQETRKLSDFVIVGDEKRRGFFPHVP